MVWSGTQTQANNTLGTVVYDTQATYVYTFEGRLWQVFDGYVANPLTPGNAKSVVYNYDADGNRHALAKVTRNGNDWQAAWTYFAVDTQQPYAEVVAEWTQTENSSNQGGSWPPVGPWQITAQYDLGLDRLRVATSPTNSYWYLFDGLGSTRALTLNTGSRADGYTYSAYGVPSLLTGSMGTGNTFLFNAQQWDGGLASFLPGLEGLYFNRARYYAPITGRFVSQDPYSGKTYEPITLHRYMYANSSPPNWTDPSGLFSIGEFSNVLSMTINLASAAHNSVAAAMLRTSGDYAAANIATILAGIDAWGVAAGLAGGGGTGGTGFGTLVMAQGALFRRINHMVSLWNIAQRLALLATAPGGGTGTDGDPLAGAPSGSDPHYMDPAEMERRIQHRESSAQPGDVLEAKVARLIQRLGWTRLVNFDRKIGPNGSITDVDMETPEAIIQCTISINGKAGDIADLVNNLNQINPKNKTVILYAPKYTNAAEQEFTKQNIHRNVFVVRNEAELVYILSELEQWW